MRAHVLLNVLNELEKGIKCEACRTFYHFFATSTNVKFYISYDIKTILKSYFWLKTLGFCHMRDIKNIISYRFLKIC